MTLYTRTLTAPEQTRFCQYLQGGGYEPHPVQYARAAARKEGLTLVLYESGKLVVQGKKTPEWLEFVFEPLILQGLLDPLSGGGGSAAGAIGPGEDSTPRIGVDESGKGDFFGPMVIAGFLWTPELAELLRKLGVKDSKQMASDAKMLQVAETLERQCPTHIELICLMPATYNRMVARMGGVNRVLAWGHATVMENLLERHPQVQKAVADQFGPEHQIRNALKTRGKAIELVQRHRAESDPAVAAASILARAGFVRAMKDLGELAGQTLPKGATHVRGPAEILVRAKGPDILRETAKTHFRTTRQVLEACGYAPDLLGTPEPKAFVRPGKT